MGYTGAEHNRLVMWGGGDVLICGTVATDLNYLSDLYLLLRSER